MGMRVVPGTIGDVLMPKDLILQVRFEEPGKFGAQAICVVVIILGFLALFFSPDWLKDVFAFMGTYARTSVGYNEDPDRAAIRTGLSLIAIGAFILIYFSNKIKQPPRKIKIFRDRIRVSYIIFASSIKLSNVKKVCISNYQIEIFYQRNGDKASGASISGHTGDLLGLDLRPIVSFLRSKGVEVVHRTG